MNLQIGENIRYHRTQKGLTQEELADFTSVLFNRSVYLRDSTDSADAEYKKPSRYLEWIRSMPVYDCVRSDRRFLAAAERLKEK